MTAAKASMLIGHSPIPIFSAPTEALSHPCSILVVDDNDLVREMVCTALGYLGHSVACANNGAEAITTFSNREFDVVITDIVMPVRDGFEVITELKARGAAARIIAMTGDGRSSKLGYLQIALGLGAHASLAKPFTIPQLIEVVTLLTHRF